MEFKFSVLFGIVLAIIVLAVANVVWMVDPAYVTPAAIITIVIFTLIFTKLYISRVSVSLGEMITVSIIWLVIDAIVEAIQVFALGLDVTTYYSNYMIYVGYILIVIFATIGYKLFSKTVTTTSKPEERPAETSTPPV